MEKRYEKFRESRQPAVKLAIAAEDYFLESTSETVRRAYGDYLRLRLRPAAELLVGDEDPERLEGLWNLQCFSRGMLDDLLKLAALEHKNVSYIWLLKKKQEICGFSPRDFSL